MNIEYIDDGSQDCPLVLVYGQETAVIRKLVEAFRCMANGTSTGCEIHDILEDATGMVRLFASVSKRDVGVVLSSPTAFEWKLTADAWGNVIGLLESFSLDSRQREGHRHQYLEQAGDISVIVSTDRSW